MKLTGNEAIEYAAENDVQLFCYANPIDDGGPVTYEQATEIAREDAGLIYCEIIDGFASHKTLFELPSNYFDRCDGELYGAIQAAGYGQSIRNYVNAQNAWGKTISELMADLTQPVEAFDEA